MFANTFLLNFSHGSHEDHGKVIKIIREINDETGQNVAILADLQGPKISTGDMENNSVELKEGATLKIVTEAVIGTSDTI